MTMIATANTSHFGLKPLSVLAYLTAAIDVRKQRNSLKSLETEQLNDLGITYKQALREAKRPVWDVPKHWKRKFLRHFTASMLENSGLLHDIPS